MSLYATTAEEEMALLRIALAGTKVTTTPMVPIGRDAGVSRLYRHRLEPDEELWDAARQFVFAKHD